jgi:hypothetical protein
MTLHEKKMKLQVLSQGIMVDVEAAGRAPSLYSLLSIGATLISNPSARFYIELCPDKAQYEKEAIRAIGHDDLSYFYRYGVRPSEALSCFATWVQSLRLTSPLLWHTTPRLIGCSIFATWLPMVSKIRLDTNRLIRRVPMGIS